MSAEADRDDGLVTLARVGTPFEAHALVALLDDEGIEAVVVERAISGPAFSAPSSEGVAIRVSSSDLSRARAALEQRTSDSIDVDWDSIDVGVRVDALPLTAVGRVPLLVRVAMVAVAALLAVVLIAAVVALFV